MPAIPVRSDAQSSRAEMPRHLSSVVRHIARRIFSTPTQSTSEPSQLHRLQARQNQVAIPATYQGLNAGPNPGTVAGIVLGSVAGFILLIWLFSALSGNMRGSTIGDEEVVTQTRVDRRRSRSRKSRRSEMTSTSPRPQRVVRQERIIRETSRGPPIPEAARRQRNSFIVEQERPMRRVDGDDVVEVIEEGSSIAPRRKSKRGGSRYG